MKTIKLISALALTSALTSTAIQADTYSTTVSVENLAAVLAWSETTPMQFATLVIDGASVITSHQCFAGVFDDAAHNELCPGDRSSVSPGVFTVTGFPNASVNVAYSAPSQTHEGIQFIIRDIDGYSLTLDAAGQATYRVGGQLVLRDKSVNLSNDLTFTYDVEFSAQ